MFVTTFYSYKGGVGRTMALANVAAELSRRGKSVLIADFDLEAPGVSSISFNNCDPSPKNSLGIVDFVHKWLLTDEAPHIENYVTSCPSSGEHGTIWIMPAGNQDEDYGTKLQEIDWADLYEKHDGYLLLEDLKRQWKAKFNPDYVLIDSRTGHTDIGGICTRQLPDLVAFIFWPNIQNLTGLQLVTAEMEAQEKIAPRKIKQLFVPSNLPTIDDEEEILKAALSDFRTKLHYGLEDEIQIHNYQSIDFLKQLIFTTKRPKTSIAQEFRNLTDAIMTFNMEDEFGIKLFLNKLTNPTTRKYSTKRGTTIGSLNAEYYDHLSQIEQKEWDDPQIHKLLANYYENEHDTDRAILALRRAINKGLNNLESHYQLARLLFGSTDRDDALLVVNRILNDPMAESVQVAAALRLLSTFATLESIDSIIDAPALLKLDDLDWMRALAPLRSKRKDIRIAAKLLKGTHAQQGVKWGTKVSNELSLIAIGGGEFEFALELLRSAETHVSTSFNIAMAKWGASRLIPKEDFERTAQLMQNDLIRTSDANFQQCWALVLIALGRFDEVKEHIDAAKRAAAKEVGMFSCWSYLERRPLTFLEDLNELAKCSEVGAVVPSVFSDAWHN